jgi:hypothetical protein
MIGRAKAHEVPVESIAHYRETEKTRQGRVRDIGDPQTIGRGGAKLRSTTCGAGRALRSRTVVVAHWRRLTPSRPALAISRATRLRPA